MTIMAEILQDRERKYGSFCDLAALSQSLKDVLSGSKNWRDLCDDKREALEMIMHKVARILNGDPNHLDSWLDIIGYATLITMDLEPEE